MKELVIFTSDDVNIINWIQRSIEFIIIDDNPTNNIHIFMKIFNTILCHFNNLYSSDTVFIKNLIRVFYKIYTSNYLSRKLQPDKWDLWCQYTYNIIYYYNYCYSYCYSYL